MFKTYFGQIAVGKDLQIREKGSLLHYSPVPLFMEGLSEYNIIPLVDD